MTVHLIHGAFVSGEPQIAKLAEYTREPDLVHQYGFAVPPIVQLVNWNAVRQIADKVDDGDTLVGHSNGCLIAYKIVERMQERNKCPRAVVTIAPAMRRDTQWPAGDYRVLCIHNPGDWIVEAGRIWGRFFKSQTGLSHGWGAAGRHGFTNADMRVSNWPVTRDNWKQHVMPDDYLQEIGPIIGSWLERQS